MSRSLGMLINSWAPVFSRRLANFHMLIVASAWPKISSTFVVFAAEILHFFPLPCNPLRYNECRRRTATIIEAGLVEVGKFVFEIYNCMTY